MLKVSPSEIAKFRRCRRAWYLTYYKEWSVDPSLAPATGVALLGTRIHTAMEAYYGYSIDPVSAVHYIYDVERARRPECATELGAEQDMATIMIVNYLEWAAENGVDEEIEVVATERTLDVPVTLSNGETAIVSGKLDQIVRRRFDGAYLLRDWKTVGTLSKADMLLLDEQMRIYSALLTVVNDGTRVDGALYTMMLRSKHTARANGPFYEQIHINYNSHEHESILIRLRGALDDMTHVIRMLDEGADPRLVAYPNPITDRCAWDCPFKNVCPLFDDGSRADAAMQANFIRRDPYAYRSDAMIREVTAAFGASSPQEEDHRG